MGSSGRVITSADILNGTIQGIDIANGTMLDQNFAANSIHGSRIQTNTLTGVQVADSSLSGVDISNGSMQDANFALNSIHGNKLQNGSVGSLQIIDGTIVNADVAAQAIRGGIDGAAGRIAPSTIYGPNDLYPGGIFNAQIAAQTIRGGVDAGASRLVPGSLNYLDMQANGLAVVASNVASQAFSTTGANAWIIDSANMPVSFALAVACLVTAHCLVPVLVSAAPTMARFGIVRTATDSVPNIFYRRQFSIGGGDVPILLYIQYQANLPAGNHTLAFAMAPESGGWTLSLDTNSYRSMVVYAMYR